MLPTTNLTNPDDIRVWLETYTKIQGTYTISDTGVVDIDGSLWLNSPFKPGVQLSGGKNVTETVLPVVFGRVTQVFDVSRSPLTTLKNCPTSVGSFNCDDSAIETLEGGPTTITFSYYARHCKNLKSLKGVPKHVPLQMDVGCKNLTDFTYAPETVKDLSLVDIGPTPLLNDFINHIQLESITLQNVGITDFNYPRDLKQVTLKACSQLQTVTLRKTNSVCIKDCFKLTSVCGEGSSYADIHIHLAPPNGVAKTIHFEQAKAIKVIANTDPIRFSGCWQYLELHAPQYDYFHSKEDHYFNTENLTCSSVWLDKAASRDWCKFHTAHRLETQGTLLKPTAQELRTMINNRCTIIRLDNQYSKWADLYRMTQAAEVDWLAIEQLFQKLYREPLAPKPDAPVEPGVETDIGVIW